MEKIRVERNDGMVRLWNDTEGIALQIDTDLEWGKDRFRLVMKSLKLLKQGHGVIEHINKVTEELKRYARKSLPEVYYRSWEDVRKMVSKQFPNLEAEHIDALTTLNLTGEELVFGLSKKYPSASDDMLASYARDEENNAHCILDADYDVAMYNDDMDHDDDEGCSSW